MTNRLAIASRRAVQSFLGSARREFGLNSLPEPVTPNETMHKPVWSELDGDLEPHAGKASPAQDAAILAQRRQHTPKRVTASDLPDERQYEAVPEGLR